MMVEEDQNYGNNTANIAAKEGTPILLF